MRYSLLAAALAMAAPAFAADDDKCKDVTIKTNSASTSCKDGTITGDVTVDGSVGDTLNMSGIKKIGGDLKIVNAGQLLNIQSSDLTEIGGTLNITHCVLLGEINLSGIKKVKEIHLSALNQLQKINFGSSGKTKAKVVDIADTGLSDLSGLNVASVESFRIYTNKQLNMFNSDLTEVSDELVISKNGKNMDVNMTVLESAKDIGIDGGVRSFNVPSLQKISALRFTNNPNLESFTSKNLTQIGANLKNPGSISFIGNDKLTNISFPSVEKIYGDLTIKNNTKLFELSGFPKLKSISGAMLITGYLKKINLPKLESVDGAATIASENSLGDYCKNGFDEIRAQSTKNHCSGKVNDPNKVKSGDKLDGSSEDDDDKTDAANAAVVSMTTLAAALLVGVYQLL